MLLDIDWRLHIHLSSLPCFFLPYPRIPQLKKMQPNAQQNHTHPRHSRKNNPGLNLGASIVLQTASATQIWFT